MKRQASPRNRAAFSLLSDHDNKSILTAWCALVKVDDKQTA